MKRNEKFSPGIRILSVFLLCALLFGLFPAVKGLITSPVQAAEDDEAAVYDLKIYYYVSGTTTEVFPHFHAMLPAGTNYEWTSPAIIGYTICDENQSVISGTLDEDTTIYVYYIHPQQKASYTVNYFTVDVDEHGTLGGDVKLVKTITDTAYINEEVRVPLEVIEGYSWAVSDLLLTVTEDGLATKNIYYLKTDERVIALRTGTGYAKTITAVPGTDITDQVKELYDHPPTKSGYDFKGWDQTLERVLDDNGYKHVYMPDEDMVINAKWEPVAETYYHVEYYFENLDSDNNTLASNYTRVSTMNTIRNGLVDSETKPSIFDKLVCDQLCLWDNTEPVDEEVKNLSPEELTDEIEAIKNKYDLLSASDYIKNCPFFGYDLAFAETPKIKLDGTAVMKLYYKREDRKIVLYEYPCKVGNDVVEGNPIWREFDGKYGDLIPDTFPDYDALYDHYSNNDEVDNYKLYATKNSTNKADQSILKLYDDFKFTLVIPGEIITGTYTWGTYSGSQYPQMTADGKTITTKCKDVENGNAYFSLTVKSGTKTTTTNDFYLSYYTGMVEQNKANTASTTQNFRAFITGTDTIDGVLRFYPKFTDVEPVRFQRILYGLPPESEGGIDSVTDIGALPVVMMKETGGAPNSFTTVQTTAYPGYTAVGGKYVVDTVDTSYNGVAYNSSQWTDIPRIPKPDDNDAPAQCFINSSNNNVLTLKRHTENAYFKLLLKPVTTLLDFFDVEDTNALYIDSGVEKSTDHINVQYTESLKILYKQDDDGNLLTDENGEYIYKYYLKDPTGQKIFAGWYLDGALTEKVTPDYRCNQMTEGAVWRVYAKWLPAKATATFDAMSGTFEDGSSVMTETVNIGESASAPDPAPVLNGFKLMGWYTSGGHHYNFSEELSTDILLHAVWQPVTLTSYTVYHVLKLGESEITLSNYTFFGYGRIGEYVTVKALDASAVAGDDGHGYYISVSDSSQPTSSLHLTEDPSHNTFTFYYQQQDDWPYSVHYLYRDRVKDDSWDAEHDSYSELHASKNVPSTDMLYVTEAAPHIDGYAMIKCNGTQWNGTDVEGVRGIGYVSKYLKPGSTNDIYIYYDKLYTLTFDLQGAESIDANTGGYTARQLIAAETTAVPSAPTYPGHIFLGWNTKADGSGEAYDPDDTFTMPRSDAKLYAQWADVSAVVTDGRRLDRLTSGDPHEISIAQNGSLTALFSLCANKNYDLILPSRLKLISQKSFKQGTVITLIVYNSESGQSGAEYYFLKVDSDTNEVYLKDFIGMGKASSFNYNTKMSAFWCQLCVEFPQSTDWDDLSLSVYTQSEAGYNVTGVFSSPLIESPSGSITVTDNTDPSSDAGSFNATVAVESLSHFTADPSDKRHTHGTLDDYKAILTISLKDEDEMPVPFPKKSTLTVNGAKLKTNDAVKGVLTQTVNAGSYTVEADGLPTDKKITVCFSLCASDSNCVTYQEEHPSRLLLDSKALSLAFTQPEEYAIRATLVSDATHVTSEPMRVFAVPTQDVTLTFNVQYAPQNHTPLPSLSSYRKQNDKTYTPVDWTYNTSGSGGNATVTVTIPQGTPQGTYRLKFTIGNAEYHYNLIVTDE